jgi:Ca2+-binding EF-hand superfamily protein
MLDLERKGYIKAIDLLELLEQLNIKAERETVANLFNRFDMNSDGKWIYFDVEELLTPAISSPLVINKSLEFIVNLKSLFRASLDAEVNGESIKEQTSEVMVIKMFNECNKNRLNYLNTEDVRFF